MGAQGQLDVRKASDSPELAGWPEKEVVELETSTSPWHLAR